MKNAAVLQAVQAILQGESVRGADEAVQASPDKQKDILRWFHSRRIIGCACENQEGSVSHAERITDNYGDCNVGVDSAVNVLAKVGGNNAPNIEV